MSKSKKTFIKKAWNYYTDTFGRTILHPQYLKFRHEQYAFEIAIRTAKGKMLDIGCGRMQYRSLFERKGVSYIGLDHPNVSKLYDSDIKPDVLADARDMPFEKNSFDTVTLFQVMSYLENPTEVMNEIRRILKNNGVLIIASAFLYPLYDVPYDKIRLTPSGFETLLKVSNFKIKKLYVRGGFLDFWLLSLNVFLFKRVFDILNAKKNVFSLIYFIILIIITPPITILANSIFFISNFFLSPFKKFPNYYPTDVIIVAHKN